MSARIASPRRQRGIALIVAVLVLALAAVLVVGLLDAAEVSRARTRNSLRAEQTWQLLREDEQGEPGIDSSDEPWAQPLPPIDIPGGRIRGRLRELGGCFNINSLIENGELQQRQHERFGRLLRVLGLNPLIAAQVEDFIDPDIDPRGGGAEDSFLLGQRPPRRAANQPLAHISELRLLPAIDADAWQTLAPHVCALPQNVPLNLNTASVELWMSLNDAMTRRLAEILAREGRARYRDISEVVREFERLGLTELSQAAPVDLGVGSDYFLLQAEILFDDLPFTYSSLLQRDGTRVSVVARTRGRL